MRRSLPLLNVTEIWANVWLWAEQSNAFGQVYCAVASKGFGHRYGFGILTRAYVARKT